MWGLQGGGGGWETNGDRCLQMGGGAGAPGPLCGAGGGMSRKASTLGVSRRGPGVGPGPDSCPGVGVRGCGGEGGLDLLGQVLPGSRLELLLWVYIQHRCGEGVLL